MANSWNPARTYTPFALAVGGGGILTSIVAGSIIPALVTGVSLMCVLGFYGGLANQFAGYGKKRVFSRKGK